MRETYRSRVDDLAASLKDLEKQLIPPQLLQRAHTEHERALINNFLNKDDASVVQVVQNFVNVDINSYVHDENARGDLIKFMELVREIVVKNILYRNIIMKRDRATTNLADILDKLVAEYDETPNPARHPPSLPPLLEDDDDK